MPYYEIKHTLISSDRVKTKTFWVYFNGLGFDSLSILVNFVLLAKDVSIEFF